MNTLTSNLNLHLALALFIDTTQVDSIRCDDNPTAFLGRQKCLSMHTLKTHKINMTMKL